MGHNLILETLEKPQYKTLATQRVHLSHAGGQHQQFSTTNHYADIKKKKIQTVFLLTIY